MHKHMLVAPTFSFAFAATGTSLTSRIDNDGFISHIILVLPNFTNVVTGTLTVLDNDGNTIWTDGGAPRAKNATYVLQPDGTDIPTLGIPVLAGFTIKLTISGNAGGSGGTATARTFIGA